MSAREPRGWVRPRRRADLVVWVKEHGELLQSLSLRSVSSCTSDSSADRDADGKLREPIVADNRHRNVDRSRAGERGFDGTERVTRLEVICDHDVQQIATR